MQTAGASQGLYFLANLLFDTGDIVFVDEVTYFLALSLLEKDSRLKAVPGEECSLSWFEHISGFC